MPVFPMPREPAVDPPHAAKKCARCVVVLAQPLDSGRRPQVCIVRERAHLPRCVHCGGGASRGLSSATMAHPTHPQLKGIFTDDSLAWSARACSACSGVRSLGPRRPRSAPRLGCVGCAGQAKEPESGHRSVAQSESSVHLSSCHAWEVGARAGPFAAWAAAAWAAAAGPRSPQTGRSVEAATVAHPTHPWLQGSFEEQRAL